jgi:hypothetical protein
MCVRVVPPHRRRAGAVPRNPRALVLGHRDRQLGQLLDLMAHRLADRHQLALAEHVPTATARRPAHDHLIDRRGALFIRSWLTYTAAVGTPLPAG